MPEQNKIQAMIPRGADMIFNTAGTAAGIHAALDKVKLLNRHLEAQRLRVEPRRMRAEPGLQPPALPRARRACASPQPSPASPTPPPECPTGDRQIEPDALGSARGAPACHHDRSMTR